MNTSWFPLYQQATLKNMSKYMIWIHWHPITWPQLTKAKNNHNCVITMVSQIMATQPFVHQLVQAHKETNLHYWPFGMGLCWWPVDFPRTGPIMWKMLPYHDVIMCLFYGIYRLPQELTSGNSCPWHRVKWYYLSHRCLVMPCGVIDLGGHWHR